MPRRPRRERGVPLSAAFTSLTLGQQLSRQIVPALPLEDYVTRRFANLFPPLTSIRALSLPGLGQSSSRSSWLTEFWNRNVFSGDVFRDLAETVRLGTLPTNLRSIPEIDAEDVAAFTLTHGVSLYLVPRPVIAAALLRAPDSTAVRSILGRRRKEIVADCRKVLDACDLSDTVVLRQLALQAVDAMESDLYGPAQALAGSLLDTLLHGRHLEPDLKRAARRQVGESVSDVHDRIGQLEAWDFYIAAAMWSSFGHYFANRGDQVPRAFSRHATAHAAGGRQFSRRSAVQGLLAVTGAIGFLNGHT